jgi:hypothetical protein
VLTSAGYIQQSVRAVAVCVCIGELSKRPVAACTCSREPSYNMLQLCKPWTQRLLICCSCWSPHNCVICLPVSLVLLQALAHGGRRRCWCCRAEPQHGEEQLAQRAAAEVHVSSSRSGSGTSSSSRTAIKLERCGMLVQQAPQRRSRPVQMKHCFSWAGSQPCTILERNALLLTILVWYAAATQTAVVLQVCVALTCAVCCVLCVCSSTQTELADITHVEPQLDDVTSLQVGRALGLAMSCLVTVQLQAALLLVRFASTMRQPLLICVGVMCTSLSGSCGMDATFVPCSTCSVLLFSAGM